MKLISKTTKIWAYDQLADLNEEQQQTILHAQDQLKNAYAPYSKFRVGAAVLLQDGSYYFGCNQENASYPLCMCGERNAIYNAKVNRPNGVIKSLAIVIKNEVKSISEPGFPCGACRQVILENEMRQSDDIEILLMADGPLIYRIESGKSLLPFGFTQDFL